MHLPELRGYQKVSEFTGYQTVIRTNMISDSYQNQQDIRQLTVFIQQDIKQLSESTGDQTVIRTNMISDSYQN